MFMEFCVNKWVYRLIYSRPSHLPTPAGPTAQKRRRTVRQRASMAGGPTLKMASDYPPAAVDINPPAAVDRGP